MEELQTENLRALLNGKKLNANQMFLANREYKAIITFAYEQEKEVERLNKLQDMKNQDNEKPKCPECGSKLWYNVRTWICIAQICGYKPKL